MGNYPANHPVWNILRLLVVGVMLTALLYGNYNSVDSRDVTTVVSVIAALAGYDKLMPKGGNNEGGT